MLEKVLDKKNITTRGLKYCTIHSTVCKCFLSLKFYKILIQDMFDLALNFVLKKLEIKALKIKEVPGNSRHAIVFPYGITY